MNTAFLSLGTNMGDKAGNLQTALAFINDEIGKVEKASSVYGTEPWGVTDQPEFYNIAIQVETHLSAEKVLIKALEIEKKMGRVREKKMGQRIIDIDVLLFENRIINQADLQVPHPYMHQRNFVLVPLNEIAPEKLHPVLNKTIQDLLQLSEDASTVYKKVVKL